MEEELINEGSNTSLRPGKPGLFWQTKKEVVMAGKFGSKIMHMGTTGRNDLILRILKTAHMEFVRVQGVVPRLD